MLRHELQSARRLLILRPEAALQAEDFSALARIVDPDLEQHGDLRGLLIDAAAFPGWENFAALISHLRFVRDHHRRIQRIAIVSDSTVLTFVPKLVNHFVNAEIRHFEPAARADALAWLETG